MISWNYMIFDPLKQDADCSGIEPLTAYLDRYYGARVINGSYIIFNDPRKESLFKLKYSQYLLEEIPNSFYEDRDCNP